MRHNQKKTKIIILLITLSVFIIGCSNRSGRNKTLDIKDTASKGNVKTFPHHDEGDDGPSPSLANILNDVLKSYKYTVKVDTSFLVNKRDTITIKLRHYCTYDNKINLPARYLKMYGLSTFRTHNFISALLVKRNSRVIFNGSIKKEDFDKLLDNEFKKYATLSAPNIKLVDGGLSIQYSITVPLTDVGKSVTMKIDTLGNQHIITL
jgi:hypothetical protein